MHKFAYICINSMYANLCESCKLMRIIRNRIYSNHEFMRIYSIYSNRIYSIGIDFFIFAYIRIYSLCEYMRIYRIYRMHANLCEYVTMLIYYMVKNFHLTWGSNKSHSEFEPATLPLEQSITHIIECTFVKFKMKT